MTAPGPDAQPAISDPDCVAFLQWALPRLGLRWAGYRKVRGTLRKRLRRRLRHLGLADLAAYRDRLAAQPSEWQWLETACRIPISRFFRDRRVFERLGQQVLPALARAAQDAGRNAIDAWSAGCASGEEPYSLAILWRLGPGRDQPELKLRCVATDADAGMLRRAAVACYGAGRSRMSRRPGATHRSSPTAIASVCAPSSVPGSACARPTSAGICRRDRST